MKSLKSNTTRSRQKGSFRTAKGITLISLVITIIILLILAAVAIGTLTGDNGLIKRAQDAKNNTLDAQNLENATFGDLENLIDSSTGTTNGGNGGASGGGNGGGSGNQGQAITGVNTAETNPAGAIPTGATIIEGDATKGIVMKDSKDNEWVWVEVPKTIYTNSTYLTGATTPTSNTDYTNIEKIMQNYASDYRNSSYKDEWYSEAQHGFASAEEYNTAKNNMLKSVYDNGGFWIGRYEAGNANATVNNETIASAREDAYIAANPAVIKADQIPYNFITNKQAQTLSKSLATGGKTSSLMFGIQWDLTFKFLEEKTDLTLADIKTDSKSWGNYYGSTINLSKGKYNTSPDSSSSTWKAVTAGAKNGEMLLTTGASEDTNKMNIYDFAGNEWEWTLEQYTSRSSIPCTIRGGCYYNSGSSHPASYHEVRSTSNSYYIIGFRPALY